MSPSQSINSIIYRRPNDPTCVELRSVVTDPAIEIGEYSFYNDFVRDPRDFQRNNVLYHYPINREKLIMGKFCSIGCGAKFLFTSGNHAAHSLANYPFPIFFEEWNLPVERITEAWDNKGDIILGNDVWVGYKAVIMQGVTIGDGAIIGTRAVVTRDVPPYTIVGGVPAKPIRKRFSDETVEKLRLLRWWDWPVERIRQNIDALVRGDIDRLES